MAKFKLKIHRGVLLFILLLVSILVLLAPKHYTTKANDIFYKTLGGILKFGSDFHFSDLSSSAMNKRTIAYEDYEKVVEENQLLQKKASELIRQRNKIHNWYETATGTRQRLPELGPGHIWADVISIKAEIGRLTIDRGTADGIEKGQCVIGQDYVIGTIGNVLGYTSKVELLTSTAQNLLVEIEAFDEDGSEVYKRGFMRGDGKGLCKVNGIETSYKIESGNFVYAVDMEGFLLSPMIVGKISSIDFDSKNPLFWDIVVDPSFKARSLERVFAVTMQPEVKEK
jgi:cell shape-determining protein MreC